MQQQALVAGVDDRVDAFGEHRGRTGDRERDELDHRDAEVRAERRDDRLRAAAALALIVSGSSSAGRGAAGSKPRPKAEVGRGELAERGRRGEAGQRRPVGNVDARDAARRAPRRAGAAPPPPGGPRPRRAGSARRCARRARVVGAAVVADDQQPGALAGRRPRRGRGRSRPRSAPPAAPRSSAPARPAPSGRLTATAGTPAPSLQRVGGRARGDAGQRAGADDHRTGVGELDRQRLGRVGEQLAGRPARLGGLVQRVGDLRASRPGGIDCTRARRAPAAAASAPPIGTRAGAGRAPARARGARPAAAATGESAGATTAIASPRRDAWAASSASRGCRPSTAPISSASDGPAQRGSSTPCQASAGVASQDSRVISRSAADGGASVATSNARGSSPREAIDAELVAQVDRAAHLRAGGGQVPQQPGLVAALAAGRRRRAAPRRTSSPPHPLARRRARSVRASPRPAAGPGCRPRSGTRDAQNVHTSCAASPRAAARGRRSGRRAARAGRDRAPRRLSLSSRITASTASRSCSIVVSSAASTLSRSSGSVFEARTLNQLPSAQSTVSPSSSSTSAACALVLRRVPRRRARPDRPPSS